MHKKLLQLLRDNARREISALRVENADEDEVTIYLYDVIDSYFGVSAEEFNRQLAELKGKTVLLRINSPGGDVFDGRAIATAIRNHGNVIAHIDGLAASAATYVAISAREVHMAAGAFFMIHNAWTYAYGNKHDMQDAAELLGKIDDSLVMDYAKKTGKTTDELVEMMDAETWLTAPEALEAGFVDSVVDDDESTENRTSNSWNLGAYEKTPEALINPQQPLADEVLATYRQSAERRLRLLQIA